MKEMNKKELRKCPLCGKLYGEPPALSRLDNRAICPDCGTREALGSIGVEAAEQEEILKMIHRHSKK